MFTGITRLKWMIFLGESNQGELDGCRMQHKQINCDKFTTQNF